MPPPNVQGQTQQNGRKLAKTSEVSMSRLDSSHKTFI
jgi:hypothetical protein